MNDLRRDRPIQRSETMQMAARRLKPDRGSFRDPSGRVYVFEGNSGKPRILRGLTSAAAETLAHLLAAPFFHKLVEHGEVIETWLLEGQDPAARLVLDEGWRAVAEHAPVNFVTYAYEWPFSMLKDAALLQLRLLDVAVRNGWLLKDATPFNIQWFGPRPCFIDIPSFAPRVDGDYWRGYRQFCGTFLTPLLLTAHSGIPFQPLLRSRTEGIPPDEAARHFRGLRRFKPGALPHVWFPYWMERRAQRRESMGHPSSVPRRRKQPRNALPALLDSMRRLVGKLHFRPAHSDWARYAETHSYDSADFALKQGFVRRWAAACEPSLTWDLGANTGLFSRIAAEHSQTVIALDGDQGAVDRLYRELRSGGPGNIVTLVMDLANPSPAQGWAGVERLALHERRKPDLVICLALIHHLRIAGNIPLRQILEWLRSLGATAILEFVGREDGMFRKLAQHKQEDFADCTAENFEAEAGRRFAVRDRLKLKGGSRELFLLEPN